MLDFKKNKKYSDDIIKNDLKIKQLLSKVIKHLDFLRKERDSIIRNLVKINKLYNITFKAYNKLLGKSVITSEPISLKELKHKSNAKEEKIIDYILKHDQYTKEVEKNNKRKRNLEIYIKLEIFEDNEYRTFKECQLINYIQLLLTHRYVYCENTRQIARFLNISQTNLIRKYKSIF